MFLSHKRTDQNLRNTINSTTMQTLLVESTRQGKDNNNNQKKKKMEDNKIYGRTVPS